MKKMTILNKDIRSNILDFLYKDEIHNINLIYTIESTPENIGNLYISENFESILHVKNDGNSNYVTFDYTSKQGYDEIVSLLSDIDLSRVLLSGELKKVHSLKKSILDNTGDTKKNSLYILDKEYFSTFNIEMNCKLRRAIINDEDFKCVKAFLIDFFGAETKEEMKSITNDNVITEKIRNGLYFLEYNNEIIGMARIVGITDNYIEITSVYITNEFRGRGFGRELVYQMSIKAIAGNRTPVLVTGVNNFAASRTYESLGYKKVSDFAYEFLD